MSVIYATLKNGMILFFIALLSACSWLTPVPSAPVTRYVLVDPVATTVLPQTTPSKTKILWVSDVTAPVWLNTPQMMYQLQPDRMSYFALHRWAAPPNTLLQPIIVHGLQQAGLYRAVVSGPFIGIVNQRLHLRLIQMQQQFWQHPSMYQLTLQAELVNAISGQAIATQRFTFSVPTSAATPAAGVAAANVAVAELLPQLTAFCHRYS